MAMYRLSFAHGTKHSLHRHIRLRSTDFFELETSNGLSRLSESVWVVLNYLPTQTGFTIWLTPIWLSWTHFTVNIAAEMARPHETATQSSACGATHGRSTRAKRNGAGTLYL